MKYHVRTLACALAGSLLISGCAVGNKHQYAESIPVIKAQPSKSVALGVIDKRPAVVNKSRTPDFVGVQRGGFGNPFEVTTASGNALADDMTSSLVAALKNGDTVVSVVTLNANLDETEAMRKVASAGLERGALLMLKEWKSDTYQNTALHYDLSLLVLDASGKLVARHDMKGKEDLGGSFMNPPEHAKNAVPLAYRRTMETLFSTPEISSALH